MDPLFAPIFDVLTAFAVLGGGALLVAGGVAVAPRVLGLFRQRAYDRAVAGEQVRWLLRMDAASARDPDAGRRLVAALHPGGRRGVSRWASGWPSLTLALRWADGRARWEIEAPRQLTRSVEAAVAAAYPGAELEPIDQVADRSGWPPARRPRRPARGRRPRRSRLRGHPGRAPLAPAQGRHRALGDPGLAAAGPAAPRATTTGPAGARCCWTPRSTGRHARSRPGDHHPQHPSSVGPTFSVSASLAASGAPATSLRAWLFDAVGAVGALRASGWRIEASVGGRSAPMRVGPGELAELWGLSGAASEERAVDVVRSRRLPAPLIAPAAGLRPIGLDGGRPVLVPESLFDRHVVLLGRTGSGKSTELVALAADDLRAGRGFTFIDPHGDAVARLLDTVPPDQAHRVHLLELAEKDHPRGFNPIELDGADPEIVAAQFVDTMRDLYFAHLASPPHRQLQYLRSGLLTLLTKPAGDEPWTLQSLNLLFIDPHFRAEVLSGPIDPTVKPSGSTSGRRAGAAPATRRPTR